MVSEPNHRSRRQSPLRPTVETNPWLNVEVPPSSSKQARKQNEILIHKDSAAAVKSQNTLQKQRTKTAEAKDQEKEDAEVVIDINDVMTVTVVPQGKSDSESMQTDQVNGKSQGKKKRKERHKSDRGASKFAELHDADWADGSESEVEEQERVAKGNRRPTAFEQRELVARAFAGDNVVQVRRSVPSMSLTKNIFPPPDVRVLGL